MRKVKRTPAGEALTQLMLDLFRLNSLALQVTASLRTSA
jgi:hypothetical protein